MTAHGRCPLVDDTGPDRIALWPASAPRRNSKCQDDTLPLVVAWLCDLGFSLSGDWPWQALAWDAAARVTLAAGDLARAHAGLEQALVTMEDVEVPLAAWRVHATAAALYERTGKSGEADHHRVLSRTTILQLAQSLPAAEPLRHTFLSAPAVAKVLGDAERISRST